MPEIQLLLLIFFSRTSNSFTFFIVKIKSKSTKYTMVLGMEQRAAFVKAAARAMKLKKKN